MNIFGRWVIGVIAAIVGILGLFLAAGAQQGMMYAVGLGFFIGSVLFNFLQIKNAYDEAGGH